MQKKFPKLKKESVKGIALLGFVETTLEYVFFYIGLSYASGFKGAILNPTSTFMMVILAHFFYKDDRLNFRKSLGCIVGFLGIIIVNLTGDIDSSFSFLGEGCLLISALAFALGSIISKEPYDCYWISTFNRRTYFNSIRIYRWGKTSRNFYICNAFIFISCTFIINCI